MPNLDKARELLEKAKPALAAAGDNAKKGAVIVGKGAVIAGKYGLIVGREGGKKGIFLAKALKVPWLVCWGAGYFLTRKKNIAAAEKKWNIDFADLESLTPKDIDTLKAELPRWVLDADYEKATWLNTVLEKLWPGVDTFVREIVNNAVGPILEKLSNDFGKKEVKVLTVRRRLVKIYIKEFHLGKPPKIVGIKAWNPHGQADATVLDMDLRLAGYGTNAVVGIVTTNGKKETERTVRLANLQLSAIARISLDQLTGNAPFFGGLGVSLVGEPKVDFTLVPFGGPDLLSLPGVASVIPMVLRIAVGFLLFPKHLAIKIARTDTHMIDEDLRAHKKELRKLKKKMEEEERKANKQAAKQQKKEAARGGGGAGDGAPKKPEDDEPMFAVDEKNHYNEFRLSRWPTGVLLINVMQAKDLPIADIGVGVSIDPYFKIRADNGPPGSWVQTKTRYNTRNPEYHQILVLPVRDPVLQRLRVELWDRDAVNDEMVGRGILALDSAFRPGASGVFHGWVDLFDTRKLFGAASENAAGAALHAGAHVLHQGVKAMAHVASFGHLKAHSTKPPKDAGKLLVEIIYVPFLPINADTPLPTPLQPPLTEPLKLPWLLGPALHRANTTHATLAGLPEGEDASQQQPHVSEPHPSHHHHGHHHGHHGRGHSATHPPGHDLARPSADDASRHHQVGEVSAAPTPDADAAAAADAADAPPASDAAAKGKAKAPPPPPKPTKEQLDAERFFTVMQHLSNVIPEHWGVYDSSKDGTADDDVTLGAPRHSKKSAGGLPPPGVLSLRVLRAELQPNPNYEDRPIPYAEFTLRKDYRRTEHGAGLNPTWNEHMEFFPLRNITDLTYLQIVVHLGPVLKGAVAVVDNAASTLASAVGSVVNLATKVGTLGQVGLSKSQTQGELHSQDGGILRRNMDASTAHLPEGFHFDKSFAGRKGVRVLDIVKACHEKGGPVVFNWQLDDVKSSSIVVVANYQVAAYKQLKAYRESIGWQPEHGRKSRGHMARYESVTVGDADLSEEEALLLFSKKAQLKKQKQEEGGEPGSPGKGGNKHGPLACFSGSSAGDGSVRSKR